MNALGHGQPLHPFPAGAGAASLSADPAAGGAGHRPGAARGRGWRACLRRFVAALAAAALAALAGCATNPVTGKQELRLIPESMEIELGKENYLPARQMQGGDYVADPGVAAYVREVGGRLAAVADRRLPYEFTVVNDSEPNAWALPGGKIAVNRGLLYILEDEAELAAVLSHEIVHAAARHGAKAMERGLLLMGAVALVSAAAERRGKADETAGMLVVGAAQVAAVLLGQKYSRDAEREADHYGMLYMARAGYDPAAAVSLQEKLLRLKHEKGAHPGWLERLLSSHPTSEERVRAARARLAQLPRGGERGRERYRTRLARLLETRPAYEAYDAGRKALEKERRPRKALRLARKAIRIEPREALFHALEGDALAALGRRRAALDAYAEAERLNPGYYYPKERRGLLLAKMGRRGEARAALEASLRLLDTAPARYALARIALAEGRREEARKHLRTVAKSNTPLARRALEDLLDLDLPVRAWDYLAARVALDAQGYLNVVVRNRTPVPVHDVVVAFRFPDGSRFRLPLGGVIAPGKEASYRVFNTPIPPKLRADLPRIRARVVAARRAG